jgi:hypothetical protein
MALVATMAVILVAGSLAWTHAAWANGFVSGADDLPLMEGLGEIPDGALVFDKPGGRIIDVQATGKVTRPQVVTFYRAALPQLGWVLMGQDKSALRYQRDDENLVIYLDGGGSDLTVVRFTLSPRSVGAEATGSD